MCDNAGNSYLGLLFWGHVIFEDVLEGQNELGDNCFSKLGKQISAGREGGSPQKIIQSPDGLYKVSKDYTKPRQTIENPQKTIQRHEILDKSPKHLDKDVKHLTRVATNVILPCNIKYLISRIKHIN